MKDENEALSMAMTTTMQELKTEFATVVDGLSLLHDFVESVYGTQYHNFLSGDELGKLESVGNGATGNCIQATLRKLRHKYNDSKARCKGNGLYFETLSIPPGGGRQSSESKGDNGYSSGGTPATVSMSDEGRRDSNQMRSPSAESKRRPTIGSMDSREDDRFSLSVGRPEVVAVKCEVDDTDFLDDVDPFGDGHIDYHYEGEESELKIEDCYQLQSNHSSNIHGSHSRLLQGKSPMATDHFTVHPNSSPRFIPELIPIQSEPIFQHQQLSANQIIPAPAVVIKQEKDSGSGTGSSSDDNSDVEWHPSALNIENFSSKTRKNYNKRKFSAKRTNQFDHKPATDFPPCSSPLPRQPPPPLPSSSFHGGAAGVGGAFKCDMCPASYKQEESLRSHQKYKHNPSRVQCTCHLCGKSMVDKYRLQRHLRLHTGEKPFECEYCGQCFYRKDYHTKHLQRKHGVSYNAGAGAPSKIVRKPTTKPKPVTTSPNPSSHTNFSSLVAATPSPSYQSLRPSVFEAPSPPHLSSQDKKPMLTSSFLMSHRLSFSSTPTTGSPSSSSTSSIATSSSTASEMMCIKEHASAFDMFSSHPSNERGVTGGEGVISEGGGAPISANGYYSSVGGEINNLMTMTSLTFDDLISADL